MTAADAALIFPDWPLMGGTLFPPLTDLTRRTSSIAGSAVVVGLIVAGVAVAALRTQREHPTIVRLAVAAAILYLGQAIVGGLQVLTQLAAWTQTLHVALGALGLGPDLRPRRDRLLQRAGDPRRRAAPGRARASLPATATTGRPARPRRPAATRSGPTSR